MLFRSKAIDIVNNACKIYNKSMYKSDSIMVLIRPNNPTARYHTPSCPIGYYHVPSYPIGCYYMPSCPIEELLDALLNDWALMDCYG